MVWSFVGNETGMALISFTYALESETSVTLEQIESQGSLMNLMTLGLVGNATALAICNEVTILITINAMNCSLPTCHVPAMWDTQICDISCRL